MSLISSTIKASSCLIAALGVIGSPHIYSSGRKMILEERKDLKIEKKEEAAKTKEKKKKSVIIGKTNAGENRLNLSSIANIEKMLGGHETKLKFKQLGMKWGEQTLSENDILYSPCQNGEYYLMRYYGRSGYKLENGTPAVVTPRCQETSKYKHLNHVKLDWKKRNVMGPLSLSIITVGSCSLSKIGEQSEYKLQIECKDYLYGGGNIVRGYYGDASYEYE